MQEYRAGVSRLLAQKVQMNRLRLREYQMHLRCLHPRYRLQEQQQRLSELEDALRLQMDSRLKDSRHRLAIYMEIMKGLSPIGKLNKGYSYVAGEDGKTVKSVGQVRQGSLLDIYVTDGRIRAVVEDTEATGQLV